MSSLYKIAGLNGLTLAAGLAAAMAVPAAAQDFSGREVAIYFSGGAITEGAKESFVKPFEEQTKAKIKIVEAPYDQMIAFVSAQAAAGTAEWDAVWNVDDIWLPKYAAEDALLPIEYDKIPGSKNLPESTKNKLGIAISNGAVAVSYRKSGTKLNSAADFFDPNIKGARAAAGTASDAPYMCALALLADGVKPDELVPLDVDRCLKVWSGIKDQVTSWWSSGAEMTQLHLDGEIEFCACFSGRIINAALADPDWTLTYNGAVPVQSYFTILRHSKNADVLNAFIESWLDAKREAAYTQVVGYSTPNPEAVNYLPDNLKAFSVVLPENQKALAQLPPNFLVALSEQGTAIGEAWLKFISK